MSNTRGFAFSEFDGFCSVCGNERTILDVEEDSSKEKGDIR